MPPPVRSSSTSWTARPTCRGRSTPARSRYRPRPDRRGRPLGGLQRQHRGVQDRRHQDRQARAGTWTYRVKGSDSGLGLDTAYSPVSDPVVVDTTPPLAPTASADRLPDYSGGGGWYA